ncbi:hypothetical protein DEU56DRAFT_758554 [Suillus clintonianus]|uniref:uncharacterized protein n=1 Tax=Suillus clintonianus TaxID=1904413 RepID=UPI001B880EDD|nr:uncharacterized protein DEU56DRAFT_758554 [Suillus clintonianus]KAG2127668.1 hypothetical protein DEU56DRAFT_758554 [Suillus clintonianus]
MANANHNILTVDIPNIALLQTNSTTLKFIKQKGYDVRPGDSCSIVRGPEYMTTGVVQRVDLVKAQLLLLSESNQSLVNVPMGFAKKIWNTSINMLKELVDQEDYIIGGHKKG